MVFYLFVCRVQYSFVQGMYKYNKNLNKIILHYHLLSVVKMYETMTLNPSVCL